MVAFSGFCESHKPSPLGDALGIIPPHHHGHQNGIGITFAVALAAAGAIRSN